MSALTVFGYALAAYLGVLAAPVILVLGIVLAVFGVFLVCEVADWIKRRLK